MVRAGLNLLHVMKSINKIGTFPQAWETLLFCLEHFPELGKTLLFCLEYFPELWKTLLSCLEHFPELGKTLLFCLENFHQLTEVSPPGRPMNKEKSSNKKVTA